MTGFVTQLWSVQSDTWVDGTVVPLIKLLPHKMDDVVFSCSFVRTWAFCEGEPCVAFPADLYSHRLAQRCC